MLGHQDTAIVLLAFGGPNSLDEVEPFLRDVFSGRPVSSSLVAEMRERYGLIGGSSPLLAITKRQALALHRYLQQAQRPIEVHVGMRHWHPYIHDTLEALAATGTRRILCLIMTPFATKATVEGYKIAVEQSSKQAKSPLEVHYIPSWHTNPHYLEAVSAKVKEGLALFPPQRQPHIHLLFTAHSLPLAAVSDDPYAHEIRTTIKEVMKEFHDYNWSLAFQSQGKKGGEWLSPSVVDVLENMAEAGGKEILVVPLGFVADHLEILYDLDIAVKEKAQNLGLVMHRSPSLNDSPTFVKALGDISLTVMDTLSS